MTNVRDPVRRTELCLSCHVGDIACGKFVTHDMFAAGHPPLPAFEIEAFLEQMPPHWRPVPPQSRTRSVALEGLVALRASVRLLADANRLPQKQGHADLGSVDFAVYDCTACHHELQVPSPRQERGYFGGARAVRRCTPGISPWPRRDGALSIERRNASRRSTPRLPGCNPRLAAALSATRRPCRPRLATSFRTVGPGNRNLQSKAVRWPRIAAAVRTNLSSRRRIAAGLRIGVAIDRSAASGCRGHGSIPAPAKPRRRSIPRSNLRSRNCRHWCISLRRRIHLPQHQRTTAARYGRMARISSPSSFVKSSERSPSSSAVGDARLCASSRKGTASDYGRRGQYRQKDSACNGGLAVSRTAGRVHGRTCHCPFIVDLTHLLSGHKVLGCRKTNQNVALGDQRPAKTLLVAAVLLLRLTCCRVEK